MQSSRTEARNGYKPSRNPGQHSPCCLWMTGSVKQPCCMRRSAPLSAQGSAPGSATACIHRMLSLRAAMWEGRLRQNMSTFSRFFVGIGRVRSASKIASAQRPLSRQSGCSHGRAATSALGRLLPLTAFPVPLPPPKRGIQLASPTPTSCGHLSCATICSYVTGSVTTACSKRR
jgi:hypothetical protein